MEAVPRSHPINIPYPTLLPIPPPSQKRTEIPRPLPPSPAAVACSSEARHWEAASTNPSNREFATSNPSTLSNWQLILQIEEPLPLLDGTRTNDLSLCMRVAERR